MSDTKLCQIILLIERLLVGYAVQVVKVLDIFTENESADLKFSRLENLIVVICG